MYQNDYVRYRADTFWAVAILPLDENRWTLLRGALNLHWFRCAQSATNLAAWKIASPMPTAAPCTKNA